MLLLVVVHGNNGIVANKCRLNAGSVQVLTHFHILQCVLVCLVEGVDAVLSRQATMRPQQKHRQILGFWLLAADAVRAGPLRQVIFRVATLAVQALTRLRLLQVLCERLVFQRF